MKMGDVVMLKSGGSKMTVAKVDGGCVTCYWFPELMGHVGDVGTEWGELQKKGFEEQTLKVLEECE